MKKLIASACAGVAVLAILLVMGLNPAAAEKKAKCPISGKDVDPEVTLNVNGNAIAFCCNGCPKAYKKKYLIKDGGAKECAVSGRPAKAEHNLIHMTAKKVAFCCKNCPKKFAKDKGIEYKDKGPAKCPISGGKAKADHKLVVNGESVYFCCDKCPKKYLANLNLQKGEAEKCPVSGRAIDKETEIIFVTGETKYFCCDNCPKKYIKTEIKAKAVKS